MRKIEETDLDPLLELKRESWPFTHHTTIANRADQVRWFHGLGDEVHSPRNLVLSAGLAESEVFEGFGVFKIFDVDYISRHARVGWDIFSKHRGNGLGRRLVEAGAAFSFEILNLNRLSAEILDGNERSRRCAAAAGFLSEGRLRNAVYKNGRYVDSLLFGLLRSDLPAQRDKGEP
jgi:RimJ/RimL family protein N-acetyltransferase